MIDEVHKKYGGLFGEDDEHIIIDDFHGVFEEILSHELIVDDIFDPVINPNNLKMKSGRAPPGLQGPQRMVVVDPMRNLSTFPGEKTKIADNHPDTFDDDLKIKQTNVVDANVAQIITRFSYSLLGKIKRWFNQGTDGRPHASTAKWEALKV